MAALYEIVNLAKYYGQKLALSIEFLTFNEGKVYGLAGPNGSGKSTLLKLLNLLEPPSRGEILYRGAPVRWDGSCLPLRREMAGVLQETFLWDTTVFKNVALALRWRGMRKEEIGRAVAQALSQVGLKEFGRRRARQLSGGEARRVALARALAIQPKVLFLDEPTSSVDRESSELIEKVIRRLNGTGPTTVFFATHDMGQAYRMADQVITLLDGHLTDSPLENVFLGRIVDVNGTRELVTGRLRLIVKTDRRGDVTASIDPGAVLITTGELRPGAQNCLPARVTRIEEANGQVRLTLDAGEEIVARLTPERFASLEIGLGGQVWASVEPSSVRVLQ